MSTRWILTAIFVTNTIILITAIVNKWYIMDKRLKIQQSQSFYLLYVERNVQQQPRAKALVDDDHDDQQLLLRWLPISSS